ncbi:hypothetical protein XELAEV_18028827mg [Xenopus laevis]|uniref:Uncharacterized protein n=1 Tax=Xenopus laevis TaxID=8355 RepID=A0A974HH03_XENLA|nr:hypothetical protein XELAEV_18028827mg [Xenopus laevis]
MAVRTRPVPTVYHLVWGLAPGKGTRAKLQHCCAFPSQLWASRAFLKNVYNMSINISLYIIKVPESGALPTYLSGKTVIHYIEFLSLFRHWGFYIEQAHQTQELI